MSRPVDLAAFRRARTRHEVALAQLREQAIDARLYFYEDDPRFISAISRPLAKARTHAETIARLKRGTMPTPAERTVEMFPQCCKNCGATDHTPDRCNHVRETKGARQLALFAPAQPQEKP